jgi:putative alpha-1,2-mannosidase
MLSDDLPLVIADLGGPAIALTALSSFCSQLNAGASSSYLYMGNEPAEVAPWDSVLAGAPYASQSVVRRIQTELFLDSTAGIPGNDDGGALSSWFVFSALGLFPAIQGLPGFVLGTPLFPTISIQLENGSILSIRAPGASEATAYVSSLSVNGRSYNSNPWINIGSLLEGSTLDFAVSGTPHRSWGRQLNLSAPRVPA